MDFSDLVDPDPHDPDTLDPLDPLDPSDLVVVDDQVRLLRTWRHLLEREQLDRHSLWLLLIDEHDHPVPGLVELEGCPEEPDPRELDSLVHMLRHLLDDLAPDGRVAVARSRPGSHPVDATDRRWAAEVQAACRRGGVPTDLVHLATPDRVVPLPLDDLPATA